MVNKILMGLLVIGLSALVVSGCAKGTDGSANFSSSPGSNAPGGSYTDISGGDLQTMLGNQDKQIILDVRESYEYQAGHLKGAKLIPIGELPKRIGELDKTQKIVVVCASGDRSAQASKYLVSQGFNQVFNLSGGMINWSGPVEK
ncbi:MAG: rhodanese-like domain-containing protein [Carboxydocellales bacterium]